MLFFPLIWSLTMRRRKSESHPPLETNNHQPDDNADLSLAGAVKRHVQFVYNQTNRNQRRASKLLGISRATLARHLRNLAQK